MKNKQVERLENLHSKLIERGIEPNEAIDYDLREWNKTFGSKLKTNNSLEGQKRLLSQIQNKQTKVVNQYLKKNTITNKKYIKFIERETKRLFKDFESVSFGKKTIKGKYKIAKIKIGDSIFYIKATNNADFRKQLQKIKADYQLKKGKTKKLSIKTHKYKEFVNLEKFNAFVNS